MKRVEILDEAKNVYAVGASRNMVTQSRNAFNAGGAKNE